MSTDNLSRGAPGLGSGGSSAITITGDVVASGSSPLAANVVSLTGGSATGNALPYAPAGTMMVQFEVLESHGAIRFDGTTTGTGGGNYLLGLGPQLAYNSSTSGHTFGVDGVGGGLVTFGSTNTFAKSTTFSSFIGLLAISAPATPASGSVIYLDTADGKVKVKASTGTVTILTAIA